MARAQLPEAPPRQGPLLEGPLLQVQGLTVEYDTAAGPVRAVDGFDLDVERGEFVGVVGESGCGKSTMLFGIAQLLSPPARISAGSVVFKGADLVTMSARQLNATRWRDLSVVMQSAMNALNPVKQLSAQYADVMRAHGEKSKAVIRQRSVEVLELVGIDKEHLSSYPHQLSGGMRQRAMIAMALLFTPDLIIMDEPTSALDVVAQRSLMVQIKELQQRLGFAVVFVTHDMSLVSHFSDRLVVMYAAKAAEIGPTREVFAHPGHPYTQGLLEAFPSVRGPKVHLTGIPGSPPDLLHPPMGCRFAARCPQRFELCDIPPDLYDTGHTLAACHLHSPTREEALR